MFHDDLTFLIKVFILNRNHVKTIPVYPDEYAQEVQDRIMTKIKCTKSHYFGLLACVEGIEPSEYGDFSSREDNIFTYEKWLKGNETLEKQGVNEFTVLYLRIKHWKTPLNLGEENSLDEKLYVEQIHTSMIEGYFPYPEKIAIRMAAYRIQQHFGDYDEKKHHVGFLNNVGLDEYLPRSVSRHKYAYWQRRIFKLHETLRGMSRRDALLQFIQCAKSSPYFGMTFYRVSNPEGTELSLAIAEEAVYIFCVNIEELYARIPYHQFISWESSADGILLRLKDCSIELLVESLKREEIIDLIDEYYFLLKDELKNEEIKPTTIPFLVSSSTDYDDVLHRPTLHRYTSRLDFLKSVYMSKCMLVPLISFCNQIDSIIDLGGECTSLDLSTEKLNEISIIPFSEAIIATLQYKPPNFAIIWQENLLLKTLNMSGNILRAKNAAKLLGTLILHIDTLVHLDVSGARLENQGAVQFAHVLGKSVPHLKMLEFRGALIGNKGFRAIINACKSKRMKSIDASHNRITKSVATSFLPQYILSSEIAEVKIGWNRIETNGFEALLPQLWKTSIQSLDLSANPITNRCSKSLAKLIKMTPTLRKLVWRDNRMMGGGVLKIGKALRRAFRLQTLDLSNTYHSVSLNTAFSKVFCKFLKLTTCILRELRIANNEYGFQFFEELGKVLTKNTSVLTLDVSDSDFGNAHGEIPLSWKVTLKENTNLECLHVRNCSISTLGFRTIFRSLAKNSILKELDASNNTIPEGSLEDLRIFMMNSSLQTIFLRNCKMKDLHLKCLLRKFMKSSTIELLDIRGNFFTKANFVKVLSKLPCSQTKKILVIDIQLERSIESHILREHYLEIRCGEKNDVSKL